MKTIFLPAKWKGKIQLDKKMIDSLPKTICLISSVQFVHLLDDINSQLTGKKVMLKKGKQLSPGQILGCDASVVDRVDAEAFLYVGDGQFHPLAVAIKTDKPVFCLDPFTNQLAQLKKEDIVAAIKYSADILKDEKAFALR